MAFCPHADEITGGTQCMIAIISAYLFETLPRYMPTTTLDFTTTIHKVVTKTVNIQNPSKAEITYKEKLERSHNFSLLTDSVAIPAGSSVYFHVVFAARTIKMQAERLNLSPMKPRFVSTQNAESAQTSTSDTSRVESRVPVCNAPIVVDLITEVTVTGPDVSTSIERQVYQVTSVPIQVKNLIGPNAK